MRPGELIGPLEVGAVAHGGHFVARVEGRVVFVRHALPGELVTARVTEVSSRLARADAVQIIEASAERVPPRAPMRESAAAVTSSTSAPPSRPS